MNPRDQLDAKLETFERERRREKTWGKFFALTSAVWSIFFIAVFFMLSGNEQRMLAENMGPGITIYSAGITLLVVFSWWRARKVES